MQLMFNFIKNIFSTNSTEETDMYATILPMGNRYGLVSRDGTVFGTYARARDAKRGATRRGVTLEQVVGG